jgi:hypothetical protein
MPHAFALSGNNLISFDTATPSTGTTIGIAGINAAETLVGIDFRPQNGLLYALGVDAAANTATLYTISTRTGVASPVGVTGSIALTVDGVTAIDFPDPATAGWGFDFNPAQDRIRVVTSTGLNFRINPTTGTAIDSDLGTSGVNPDSAINGSGATGVDGAAYTNNQPNTAVTTLYTLDSTTNSIYIQNPANGGIENFPLTVTLNGSPLDFTAINAFDIPAGVNAAASNTAVTTGSAVAALVVGGTTGLYSINLVNGAATFLGTILNGATPVTGIAIQSDLGGIPAVGLSADGSSIVRFNTASPGTTTTVAVTGLVLGETLVGVDFRPSTGQLYGLGVNAASNTATLYLVDPQIGSLSIIGVASQIALTTDGITAVDLPDPATAGYGFDFNPAADRIRVTTSTGLNFRINPNTGFPVDGDNTGVTTGTVSGINPDGAINGSGSFGVSAAAYTNSYGGTVTTTLYTLDATLNALLIQNPPNTGTETTAHVVTLGGSPLDFTNVNGFDIPPGVSITTSNTPASGFGYAALTVAGVTSLYQIDLATGAATNLGALATGLGGLTLADAPSAPTITSDGGGTTANLSVAENTTAVTTVTAHDGDLDPVQFFITGGADAAKFTINATSGALSFIAAPNFEAPTDADANNIYIVQVSASDGSHTGSQILNVTVSDVLEAINLTPADDSFTVSPGTSIVNGLGGTDMVSFNFKLTDAVVSFSNGVITVDGPGTHAVLTGFEVFKFTDGAVNNRDGNPLVDDLFYYAKYHDVWVAGADADAHFATFGWKEGRDPNAFFDTKGYLAHNPDVAAAGINPLTHYDLFGFKEGRDPSTAFDTGDYLAHNPDVAAAGVDPLAHFLRFGSEEGRLAFGDGVWG